MTHALLTVEIRHDRDVVLARQRARQVAEAFALERQDGVRFATAVSEMARNAYQYAQGGKVEFLFREEQSQRLQARVIDHGKGIRHLDAILKGQYVSATGLGLGIIGAKRLMDEFQIHTDGAGTSILLGKNLPAGAPRISGTMLDEMAGRLSQQTAQDPVAEIQRQNQEMLATMAELERRQEELSQLNRELEDTNRGVVALYAELDQQADYLRRVSESKTRFLANMTHEFRTPLNSIISLSRMLADRLDGTLTPEQEKQVGYIRTAAADLSSLVDDLLDLAKVEAGKVSVRPETFELGGLFNSLRGTLRPLLEQHSSVNLVFEEPQGIPILHTDEAKLSQILRNFLSNALKYTERGEVRVSARLEGADHVLISVADTGIGISAEDHARIFEEFEQVEGPHQKKAKSTGLGLPLARSLAELLGGAVQLESAPGRGSTFSVRLPVRYEKKINQTPAATPGSARPRILIVDDDAASRYVLKGLLAENRYQIAEAEGGTDAVQLALSWQPSLIFLDLGLPDLDGRTVLHRLKENRATAEIPVVINTARPLDAAEMADLAIHAVGVLPKNQPDSRLARESVRELLEVAGVKD